MTDTKPTYAPGELVDIHIYGARYEAEHGDQRGFDLPDADGRIWLPLSASIMVKRTMPDAAIALLTETRAELAQLRKAYEKFPPATLVTLAGWGDALFYAGTYAAHRDEYEIRSVEPGLSGWAKPDQITRINPASTEGGAS
jgi:hypothetical protein